MAARKKTRKKAPKPPKGLPGRYLASKNGRGYWYIIEASKPELIGGKMVSGFKLRSLLYDVVHPNLYTLEELQDKDRFRILTKRPSDAAIEKAKNMPPPWAKD